MIYHWVNPCRKEFLGHCHPEIKWLSLELQIRGRGRDIVKELIRSPKCPKYQKKIVVLFYPFSSRCDKSSPFQ